MSSLMKNTSYSFLNRVVIILFGILVSVVFTRVMGPNDYGVYVLVTSFVVTAYTFLNLGIPISLPYFIPKHKENRTELKSILKVAYKAIILLSAAALVIFFFASGWIESVYRIPNLGLMTIVIFIGALPFFVLNFNRFVFQGFQKLKYVFYEGVLTSTLRLVIPIFLYLLGGLVLSVAGYSIVNLISFLVFTFVIYKLFYPRESKSDHVKLRDLRNYATVSYISSIFLFFFIQFDYLILGLVGAEAVAFFSIAHLFRRGVISFPLSAGEAFLPKASENFTRGENFNDSFRLSVKYSSISSIFFGLMVILLSEPAILLIYGTQYAGAITAAVILGAATLIEGIFKMYSVVPYSINKPKLDLYASAVKAALNVALCILLIPLIGVAGAAVALLCSIVIGYTANVLLLRGTNIKLNFPAAHILKVYFPASLISLAPVYLLWIASRNVFTVLLSPLSLIAVYFILSRFGDEEDKMILGKIKNRMIPIKV